VVSVTATRRLEVKDNSNNLLAYLTPQDGVKDCQIDLNLNGACTLSFLIPFTSDKHQYLTRGNHIIADGRDFLISAPTEGTGPKKRFDTIKAEESWILLNKQYPAVPEDNVPLTVTILSGDPGQGGFPAGSAGSALYRLLQGSGWNVGTVDVGGIFDLETEKLSRLANIYKIQKLWGGLLAWDSLGKVLSLRDEELWQPYKGFQVRYAKNLKEITRIIDNDIITKLYPFGEDDLNIAAVNGGLLYIENYSYSTEVLEGVWQNQNIYDANMLKTVAEKYLKKMCRPRYSYSVRIADLRILSEYEHETFDLGDIVDVIDDDIGIHTKQRVYGYKYDFFQPWKCELLIGEPGYSLEREIAETIKIRERTEAKTNYSNKTPGSMLINYTVPNEKIISLDLDKLQPAKNNEKPVDSYGFNPFFIKRFPNKIWNSSFEAFNSTALKPYYWSAGVSSPDASWDSDYSLKLSPGQICEQEEISNTGFVNPDWWDDLDTRTSFRHKLSSVRVWVVRVSTDESLTLTDNDSNTGSYLDFPLADNWNDGYRTFKFTPPASCGKVKVKFQNTGSSDLYIDAVQMEPDFTGKWPSFYTHGPKSDLNTQGRVGARNIWVQNTAPTALEIGDLWVDTSA